MFRVLFALALLGALPLTLAGQKPPPAEDPKNLPKMPLVGRPGELSEEEEQRLDKIINWFILFDIGQHRDPRAVQEFNKLGPEAIPALIRGLQKASRMQQSCPVGMIAKKLRTLIGASSDEEVLNFVQREVGAIASATPSPQYRGLLNDLRTFTMLRKREVAVFNAAQRPPTTFPTTPTVRPTPSPSPSEKPPPSKNPFTPRP